MFDFMYDHPGWSMILVIVIFVGGLIIVSNVIGESSCRQVSSIMNIDYDYTIMIGCMIEIEDNKWIPLESYYYKEEK